MKFQQFIQFLIEKSSFKMSHSNISPAIELKKLVLTWIKDSIKQAASNYGINNIKHINIQKGNLNLLLTKLSNDQGFSIQKINHTASDLFSNQFDIKKLNETCIHHINESRTYQLSRQAEKNLENILKHLTLDQVSNGALNITLYINKKKD